MAGLEQSWPRADAHIHLFSRSSGPESYRMDNAAFYDRIAHERRIVAALVVGVWDSAAGLLEDFETAAKNTEFLAAVAKEYSWARPAAFAEAGTLTVEWLEELAASGPFVGIAMYSGIPDPTKTEKTSTIASELLAHVDDSVWIWLARKRWLVSVNDSCNGEGWNRWAVICARHPDLRLLISHLGLPERAPQGACKSWTDSTYRANIAKVLALAKFPRVMVKLSGFYALSTPGHEYPHVDAFGYVQQLLEHFGASRLLWASDFPPSITAGHLSFPQTIDVLSRMPFLSVEDRHSIEGGNLLTLLADVAAATKTVPMECHQHKQKIPRL